MTNLEDEELEQGQVQEEVSAPAKIEKISLTEITQEKEKQENEKTDALVKRILDKIFEIEEKKKKGNLLLFNYIKSRAHISLYDTEVETK